MLGPGHSLRMASVSLPAPRAPAGSGAIPDTPASPGPPIPEFADLYREHIDFVWRNLRRLGVSAASLDDAVQDVFVVVHRRLATWEGRSSLRTWLFGIALRVARDQRRSVRRKGEPCELPPDLPSPGPDPLTSLEHNEALRRLDRALLTLDEDKRAVFVMMEIEQMTAPEVVEATGLKVNTVYSRLRLARAELQAYLDDSHEGVT